LFVRVFLRYRGIGYHGSASSGIDGPERNS